jgi:hypothetical protein
LHQKRLQHLKHPLHLKRLLHQRRPLLPWLQQLLKLQ